MIYQEILPENGLTDFVKCYWSFHNTTSEPIDNIILPDGCFDLIIHFENRVRVGTELTGLWTKPVEVSIPSNVQIFGIRFKLLAADYILNRKLASFCNGELRLPGDFWQLDRLSFNDISKIVRDLDMIMLSILADGKEVDHRKQRLFNQLYSTEGDHTITYYAEKAFWTARQINRYFKDRFGLPLKAYCSILKCFASLKQIKTGNLYPDQNFFDRAHFIKTLKKYTGTTASDLYLNKNDRFLQLTILPDK